MSALSTLEAVATAVSALEKRIEAQEAKTAKLEAQVAANDKTLPTPLPPGPTPTTKG